MLYQIWCPTAVDFVVIEEVEAWTAWSGCTCKMNIMSDVLMTDLMCNAPPHPTQKFQKYIILQPSLKTQLRILFPFVRAVPNVQLDFNH